MIDDGSHAPFLYNADQREQEGVKYKNMKKLILIKCLLSILLYSIPISGYAQSYDVSVPKPGKLSSQIKDKKEMVISLKVQGKINSKDILYIRSLPNLEILRLGDAQIVSGGKDFKVLVPKPHNWKNLDINNKNNTCEERLSNFTEDDILPTGCFSGLKKLSAIELPKSLKKMTYNVFWDCPNLEEILINGRVTVYNNTFAGCPKLSRISLHSNGIISAGYIRDKINIDYLIFVDKENLDYSNWGNLEERFNKIFVPHYIQFPQNNHLALYNNFGSNEIKDGVSIIWDYAFAPEIRGASGNGSGDKNIKNIIMPNSVVWVGYRAFQRCSNLSHVKFSSNLRTIMAEAFDGCNLLEIELLSIEYIGKFAFRNNTQLKKCFIGNKLATIQDMAFQGCRVSPKINVPKTVTTKNESFKQEEEEPEWGIKPKKNLKPREVKPQNIHYKTTKKRVFSKMRVTNIGHLSIGAEFALKNAQNMPFSNISVEYDTNEHRVKIQYTILGGEKGESIYYIVSGQNAEYECKDNKGKEVHVLDFYNENKHEDSLMVITPDDGVAYIISNQ